MTFLRSANLQVEEISLNPGHNHNTMKSSDSQQKVILLPKGHLVMSGDVEAYCF